eukprot:TRINITY_DN10398_c0_g1_i1.p1 TRINITY_DN10398_c0_g1~~TRINITY_DN10398_c0_g1_i1.p1  ORF type:complete len:243 (+),score=54.86 TRINITY_DN10398_c0_g1_i1:451-1179(+)
MFSVQNNRKKKIEKLIATDSIGNVISFNFTIIRPFDATNPYVQTSWRQNPLHVGGYLSDGGVHFVSFITAILGPVDQVCGFTRQIQEMNGADDTLACSLLLKGGQIGSLNVSFASCKYAESTLIILGSKGTIIMNGFSKLSFINENKEVTEFAFDFAGNSGEYPEGIRGDLVMEMKDWWQVICSNDGVVVEDEKENAIAVVKVEPEMTVEEGFHHLAVCAAALESAKNGTFVKVASLPDFSI